MTDRSEKVEQRQKVGIGFGGASTAPSIQQQDIQVLIHKLDNIKKTSMSTDDVELLKKILQMDLDAKREHGIESSTALEKVKSERQAQQSTLTRVITAASTGTALGLASLTVAPAALPLAAAIGAIGFFLGKLVSDKLDTHNDEQSNQSNLL